MENKTMPIYGAERLNDLRRVFHTHSKESIVFSITFGRSRSSI